MEQAHLVHPIPPVYDHSSEILILGSFPSVKSREVGFYYGHPQNRFWRVLAALYHEPVPLSVTERKQFLIRNRIALWDVIASCSIIGSSDSSIRDVRVNDFERILSSAPIRGVYFNGKTAQRLFERYAEAARVPCVCLPSTSPANAAWSVEGLIFEWRIILER